MADADQQAASLQQAADKDDYDDETETEQGTDDDDVDPDQPAGREEEWDEWQDGEGEDEDVTKSLFGPERLPNAEAAMDHDGAKHGFDIRQFAIQVGAMERVRFGGGGGGH